jgi:hypothetical protein
MLTAWFEVNQNFEEVRNLTYCDFPPNGDGMSQPEHGYLDKIKKEKLGVYTIFIHL